MNKLRSFKYYYNAGPLPLDELKDKIIRGNCRLVIQDYYYSIHDKYLDSSKILLPEGYRNTGEFIELDLNNFKTGDILYAVKMKNKKNESIEKARSSYRSEDDWIIDFHSAIYLGRMNDVVRKILPIKSRIKENTPVIWHSSFVSGGTSLWSWKKFNKYYQLMGAKRLQIK